MEADLPASTPTTSVRRLLKNIWPGTSRGVGRGGGCWERGTGCCWWAVSNAEKRFAETAHNSSLGTNDSDMQMCLLPFCFPPQPVHKRQGEWKCLIMSLSVSFIYLYAVVKNSLFPAAFFLPPLFFFFHKNLDRHFKWALCLFSLFPPSLSDGIHLLSNAWHCSLLASLWHHASRVICKGTHVGIKNL